MLLNYIDFWDCLLLCAPLQHILDYFHSFRAYCCSVLDMAGVSYMYNIFFHYNISQHWEIVLH